jgi:glycerophosphoryl diester phosphodiesterase
VIFGILFLLLHLVLVVSANDQVSTVVLARGLAANFLLGWLLSWLIAPAGKRQWPYVWWGLWLAVLGFAHAHVTINGSFPDIANAALASDSSFLVSVLTDINIMLRVAIYVALGVGVVLAMRRLTPRRLLPLRSELALVGTCLVAAVVASACNLCEAYRWQAGSVLDYNLIRQTTPIERYSAITDGRSLIPAESGTTLIQGAGPNVIVLLVEGLSQLHVDNGYAPELAQLQPQSMGVSYFVNHQRQTNRGLFATLCGAYPNLVNPLAKADLMALGGLRQDCLAATLTAEGYHTAFLQAAPLGYMSKDLFAAAAGFTEAHGDESVSNPTLRGEWGVDDLSFYRSVITRLEGLRAAEAPYFLSLLTSGTHPPFNTPFSSGDKEKAFNFASSSAAWFISELQTRGYLADTTLILMSDESSASNLPQVSAIDGDNRGVLMVFGPQIPPLTNAGVFGQVDIATSVLDLVGINVSGFGGRSIFRRYEQPRTLYAGNTFKRRLFAYEGDDLLACSHSFECLLYPNYLQHLSNSMESQQAAVVPPEDSSHISNFLDLIARSDLGDEVLGNSLVDLPARTYQGESNYQLLGRFISTLPVGDKAKVVIGIDNSVAGAEAEILNLTWIGFDCADTDPSMIRAGWKIPAGKQDNTISFELPQAHAADCHKVAVQTPAGKPSSAWSLQKFSVEKIPSQLPTTIVKRTGEPPVVPRIAHAGGSYQGLSYTDSFQALESNLATGFTTFEVDFSWTSDGHLVCSHDWGDEFEKLFGIRLRAVPSLAEFQQMVAANTRFTACTAAGLAAWLQTHPQVQIVTDIKSNNLAGLSLLATTYPEIVAQIIPQIYDPAEYEQVRKLGYRNIIWTLYRYTASNNIVLNIADRLDLFAITMPETRAATGLGSQLQAKGLPTYVHTINDPVLANKYRTTLGISELYTDTLAP